MPIAMEINFEDYVKDGNFLDLTNQGGILNDPNNLKKLCLFLQNNPGITALSLVSCNIDSAKIKLLLEKINNNITNLNISYNTLDAVGAAEIANKLPNLTDINIGANKLGDTGAAKIAKLTKLTHLSIFANDLGDVGAAEIAKLSLTNLVIFSNALSAAGMDEIVKLTELVNLDIWGNNIREGIVKIVKLSNLTSLNIGNNGIPFDKIETLAVLKKTIIMTGSIADDIFLKFLQNNNFTLENFKNIVFEIAAKDNSSPIIQYIINSPEKYPFAINSRDNDGHSLLHYYSHNPEMQQFLFQHGAVPDQDNRLNTLAQDNQSVHTTEAVKLVNFITDHLFKAYGNIENKQHLLVKAEEYQAGLTQLYQVYQDPIKLKLLGLTDDSKRNTLGETLAANQPVPNDPDYFATLFDKVKIVLTNYLPGADGQYRGYPTTEINYGDGNKITIPQSLGLVKSLIDTMEIPVAEKLELLVTLIRQNPQLVATKLEIILNKLEINASAEELVNSTNCHKLLATNPIIKNNPQTIGDLFNIISGLDIEETWREQKAFTALEAIYVAATTYNGAEGADARSACIHGVWTQIINSAAEINLRLLKEFSEFLEEEIRKEKARDSITETNIQEFIGVLAKKLIEYVKDKPALQECLAEFGSGWVDISKPSELTIERQKILAKINEVFTETIRELLPYYIKAMPTIKEYKTIITELAENNDMRKFAKKYDDYEPPNKVRILETFEVHPQQLDEDDQDGVDIIGDTEGQQL